MSSITEQVDWNAEHVRGDPRTAIQPLKREPAEGRLGGLNLPPTLIGLGLSDGHDPSLCTRVGPLADVVCRSVTADRLEPGGSEGVRFGAVTMRNEKKRQPGGVDAH